MKILINACLHIGGGLQVADSFIRELVNYPDNEYIVIISNEVKELLTTEVWKNRRLEDWQRPQQNKEKQELEVNLGFPKNFKFINIQYSKPSFVRVFSARYKPFDGIVEKYKPDVAFTIFGPAYWKPKNIPHICGFAKSQYIYTESPFFKQMTKFNFVKLKIKGLIQKYSFRRDAQIYITENEDVSKKLQKILTKHKIYTVTNYYNQVFDDEKLQQEFVLPKFNGITLLTITSTYPHKNIKIIKPVAEHLINKYPNFKFRFVVTIDIEIFGYSKNNLPAWLLPIGKVKIYQCPDLYRQSDFMFLPTLLECFSASYPEAMKMQKPILTSDLPFAHGLCGDAAEYFNPISAEDIAEKIYILANDKEKQKKLIENGLKQLTTFDTYNQRTEKYLNIIKNTIEDKQ